MTNPIARDNGRDQEVKQSTGLRQPKIDNEISEIRDYSIKSTHTHACAWERERVTNETAQSDHALVSLVNVTTVSESIC